MQKIYIIKSDTIKYSIKTTANNLIQIITLIILPFLCAYTIQAQTYETDAFNQATTGNSITVAKPLGTTSGEFLLTILFFSETGAGSFPTQIGWNLLDQGTACLLYTSPSPRDRG